MYFLNETSACAPTVKFIFKIKTSNRNRDFQEHTGKREILNNNGNMSN
jgi:hypothetical protein